MIEMLWYPFVAAATIVALGNWRVGLFAGVLVDCLRDPVRKISDEQSIAITLSGIVVWVAVILRAVGEEQGELRKIMVRYPQLRTVLTCVIMSLVPAALMSTLLYSRGWLLAIVGVVSYMAPLVGVGVGYLFATSEKDVYRLLMFYVVLNAVMLIGVPLEFLDCRHPGARRYRHGMDPVSSGIHGGPDRRVSIAVRTSWVCMRPTW